HLDLVVVGLVGRRVDAVDGADFDAGIVLGSDAGLGDHVSHIGNPDISPQTSGRWWIHGCAASICAASWSRVSSPSGLPTICTAVGSPSGPKPTGTLMAGWPVTLNSDVNGVKRPERARSSSGRSPIPVHSPMRSGRSANAGVINTS